MNIKGILWKYRNRILSWLDPEEWTFKKHFKKIDKVEGFLKSPQQERWFYRTAKQSADNSVIVEIGSFKGRSTVSFGFGCLGTSKHIYAIDLFEGENHFYGNGDFLKIFKDNISSCGLSSYVTPIKMHSLEAVKQWRLPIDVLFIDGSHEYEDVKADFLAFYPFVKPGGIVAFHDIRGMWDGVIQYWSEVQKKKLIINTEEVSSLGYGYKPL
ncbi:MAG: class I SAM-dependent methyltransferase [Cyclobacteriaceae bacterium]|nr:class I SAM-dependent methyltransferase [Cyclobacteriaceae bacterium]